MKSERERTYNSLVNELIQLVLTVEVFGAAVEAILVLLTLLCRSLVVADGRREHARSVLHEELHHRQVVT